MAHPAKWYPAAAVSELGRVIEVPSRPLGVPYVLVPSLFLSVIVSVALAVNTA